MFDKASPTPDLHVRVGIPSVVVLLARALQLLASKTAYYMVCMRPEDLFVRNSGKRGRNSFLGKLRASTKAHTEYSLYDR